jgi:integrase
MLLLAYTGLRWREAIGLRIGDLDMLRRRASISEDAVQYGTEIYVGTPKRTSAAPCRCPNSC